MLLGYQHPKNGPYFATKRLPPEEESEICKIYREVATKGNKVFTLKEDLERAGFTCFPSNLEQSRVIVEF